MALELRLPMFQHFVRVTAKQMRAPQKITKTAIDLISSYLTPTSNY